MAACTVNLFSRIAGIRPALDWVKSFPRYCHYMLPCSLICMAAQAEGLCCLRQKLWIITHMGGVAGCAAHHHRCMDIFLCELLVIMAIITEVRLISHQQLGGF